MNPRWMRLGFALVLPFLALPQEQETRALWDSTFLQQRPPAKNKRAPASTVSPPLLAAQANPDRLLGLTVWRLRRRLPADEPGTRILEHGDHGNLEWTPERIDAETPLAEGQRVRFSIESARSGYLYVIDREEYESGSTGESYLIFPTTRIRGGDNRLAPGTTIELPAWDDNPPYLLLKRTRSGHVGEMLTILVTPEPLFGITVGRQPVRLPAGQVALWEKTWGAPVARLEIPETGKAYTSLEKAAGAGLRPLTQADPVPHTLYRVEAKAGDPLLVKVRLPIQK